MTCVSTDIPIFMITATSQVPVPVRGGGGVQHTHTLLQKRFIVSAVKSFFVLVSPADTILRIQKIDYFSYRLFPADTQNRFSKKKIGAQIWARWPQIGPCSPTPVEVDVVAGSPRASIEQWESLDRRAVGAVGPHRLDRRVLLVAAEHHLRLASDWSRRCRRLRPEPPRTPTWPSRFGRPP
jgi:hypothetical protein